MNNNIFPNEETRQIFDIDRFRKISDSSEMYCLNEEHNPPMYIHLQPGVYEYKCPGCGKITIIKVPLITC